MAIPPLSILGQNANVEEEDKYLVIHTDNRLNWKTSTETVYRNISIRKLRSFYLCSNTLKKMIIWYFFFFFFFLLQKRISHFIKCFYYFILSQQLLLLACVFSQYAYICMHIHFTEKVHIMIELVYDCNIHNHML